MSLGHQTRLTQPAYAFDFWDRTRTHSLRQEKLTFEQRSYDAALRYERFFSGSCRRLEVGEPSHFLCVSFAYSRSEMWRWKSIFYNLSNENAWPSWSLMFDNKTRIEWFSNTSLENLVQNYIEDILKSLIKGMCKLLAELPTTIK